MPKYLIDTDAGTCVPFSGGVLLYDNIADAIESCLGASEWDATTEKIQTWFYGSFVKDAWCATGLSYFSMLAKKLTQTGQHENVDSMKEYMDSRGMLDCTKNYGGGAYVPKRGDVVFMSGKYSYLDCTHVGVVSEVDTHTGRVVVTSCNCDNSIKKKTYNYLTDKYIVAWGKID